MKHFINRASLLLGIACLCMVPIGFVIHMNEWGDFPNTQRGWYLMWAIVFAVVNHLTQPDDSRLSIF